MHRAQENDQIQHGQEHIWVKGNRSMEANAYMYGAIVSLVFFNMKRFRSTTPQVAGFATTDTIKSPSSLMR